jgi:hypothetical protein
VNAKYYIYWNLHKKCFSAKYRGKVIKHFHNAIVAVPEFRVSAAGRERVRRERKKTVHAYIVSNYVNVQCPNFVPVFDTQPARTAKYNPYVNESFVDNEGNALYNAHEARLSIFNGKPVIEVV